MFGIEKDFQNLMEQVYGPLNKDKMTEIEELKSQIKVLQKKLSFLEELEKTKSPVEEAYKRVYGVYPTNEITYNSMWGAFQKGYYAAQDYKVGEFQEPEEEPEELKTLYQMFDEEQYYHRNKIWIIVKNWMSQYTHNVMSGEYLKGYEECLTVLKENLK